jgi:hypothetical protein
MIDWRGEWGKRPGWMNLIFIFCVYMTFGYMPFDMFIKPMAEDQEVWFGVMLVGWWAKATEPLHWFIYGAGAYGFWKMRPWMWPWAALYVAQVALGMLVWSLLYAPDQGPLFGVAAFALFAVPAVALWRAKGLFRSDADGE